MANKLSLRKKLSSPLGTALLVLDIWRRLPPRQRRQLNALVRKHGLRFARNAFRRKQGRKKRT